MSASHRRSNLFFRQPANQKTNKFKEQTMSKENIYQFIDLPRTDPQKIPLAARKKEFVEIYQAFTDTQAQSQADRCLGCGNVKTNVRCTIIFRTGCVWRTKVASLKRRNWRTPPTRCLKCVDAFAHKTACVKAIAH